MKPPSTLKIILVAVLDFLLAFIGFGMLIAWITGDLGPNGFALSGIPAVISLVLVVAYFVVLPRLIGGTVFQHVFGIAGWRRRQG